MPKVIKKKCDASLGQQSLFDSEDEADCQFPHEPERLLVPSEPHELESNVGTEPNTSREIQDEKNDRQMSDEEHNQKVRSMSEVKLHPAANIFPMMEGPDFDRLCGDIQENGLLNRIIFFGETIETAELIDGRNRLKACQELGINWLDHVALVKPQDMPDPVSFVLTMNLIRRHLNDSQRAMIAARVANLRQGRPELNASIDAFDSRSNKTQVEAATGLNVSRKSVQRARKVQDKAVPGIVQAVERGEVSVSAAAEVSNLSPIEQERLIELGPNAIKDAASQRRSKVIDRPQHGTTFDPSGFDSDTEGESEPDKKVDDAIPEHLTQVLIDTKFWVNVRSGLTQLKKQCHSHSEDAGSHYINMQEIDRMIDQLASEIKCRTFGCNCPACKNKLNKKCPKCGGVGWIPVARVGHNTDADRAWLDKQQRKKAV